MKKLFRVMVKTSPILFILLLTLQVPAGAETYYIRIDGGNSTQCTGTANAPWPGSGTDQACALSHPFYLLDTAGNWRIQGGDTIWIGPGSYPMGYGADNTSNWCDAFYPYDCHLPPIPSGTPTTPTRILGKGWDDG